MDARGRDRYLTHDGYVTVYDPGPIAEHRLVVSEHLGRKLRPLENVHHKNGDRSDNSLSNLELWVRPQPSGQRVSDLLEQLVEGYQDELLELLRERGAWPTDAKRGAPQ